MNLRWLERRIPDSTRVEKVLQYERSIYGQPDPKGLLEPISSEWIDVPLVTLQEQEKPDQILGRGIGLYPARHK